MIKCIQSNEPIRTYVVRRDISIDGNPLYGYSVYDTFKKRLSYRLTVVSSDIDSIILVDYPKKNIVGNLEGEWKSEWNDDVFNVSFSLYDYKLNKWIDGNIKKVASNWWPKYSMDWNGIRLVANEKRFPTCTEFYDQRDEKTLLAKSRRRNQYIAKPITKYDLKIFSDKVPDTIYLFTLAIMDHLELT